MLCYLFIVLYCCFLRARKSTYTHAQTSISEASQPMLLGDYTNCLGLPACNGAPTKLRGRRGEFGVVGSQYTDDLFCQWNIRVKARKVSYISKNAGVICSRRSPRASSHIFAWHIEVFGGYVWINIFLASLKHRELNFQICGLTW